MGHRIGGLGRVVEALPRRTEIRSVCHGPMNGDGNPFVVTVPRNKTRDRNCRHHFTSLWRLGNDRAVQNTSHGGIYKSGLSSSWYRYRQPACKALVALHIHIHLDSLLATVAVHSIGASRSRQLDDGAVFNDFRRDVDLLLFFVHALVHLPSIIRIEGLPVSGAQGSAGECRFPGKRKSQFSIEVGGNGRSRSCEQLRTRCQFLRKRSLKKQPTPDRTRASSSSA